MFSITLAMIVKNEQQYLERCLRHTNPLVEDIVVVDTGSVDSTRDIAINAGAHVFDFTWQDDFAAARNFALSKVETEWALVLDADEYFPHDQSEVLKSFIGTHRPDQAVGRINIVSRFIEDGAEQTVQAEVSRLFSPQLRYTGCIHEQLVTSLPRISTGLELLHDGYFQTNKSDRNIRLLQKELANKPYEPYLLFQLAKEYKGIDKWSTAEELFEKGYMQLSEKSNYAKEAVVDYLYILLHNKKYNRALEIISENIEILSNLADFFFVGGLVCMDAAIANPHNAGMFLNQLESFYLRCISLGFENGKEIVKGTSTFLPAYNLGLYYEMMEKKEKAKEFYMYSAEFGYQKAIQRLNVN